MHYLTDGEKAPFLSLLNVEDETKGSKGNINSAIPNDALELEVDVSRRTIVDISKHKFKIAVSFPGEVRALVQNITELLEQELGADSVFYDFNYQSQLARPSIDTLLQSIYRERADLIMVFISDDYQRKDWCGIEFRAIREIVMQRAYQRIMYIRTGEGVVEGVLANDGYIDARRYTPAQISSFAIERLDLLADELRD
ncbi:disease resistance protein [Pseudoduganella armeniaca]|uniref:Disease resistance protein n=2 Tax=Pseudoduganella armeniaca TaxID=2072590 RepID=A0A2R4CI36_9BURK|nr:disease resistance protein [Pseudoduganella armeniaca]